MRGRRFVVVTVWIVVMGLCIPAMARTLYVAPDGDDLTAEAENPQQPFQSLTNAFQSLRNGDRLEIGAGKYTVTPGYPNTFYPLPDHAPMKLRNLTNVTVVGMGEVEIYGEGPGDFLMVEFCKNVRIENLTFKGNRPPVLGDPPELYTTVLLRGHNDSLRFDGCRFLAFGNHAISHLFSGKNSMNTVVTNCYFADGGAVNVADLDVDGAAVSGISSGSRIVNNVIERCLRGIEVEGIYDGTITNVIIEGNYITNCYSVGIMVFATCHLGFGEAERYRDIRVLNNRIVNMYPHPETAPYTTYGIVCWGGEKMLIAGNWVQNARLGMGIDASSVQMSLKDVTVVSNVVEDVRFRGIQMYEFNALKNGVVRGNIVRRAGDEGVLLSGENLHCLENVVENTAWVGERASITLMNGGVNGVIADNVIRNETAGYSDFGIWLYGATNTTVYGNRFEGVPQGAIRDDARNSKLLPKVHSMRKQDSMVDLMVSGLPGMNYRLEVSHDFANWTTVTNLTLPGTAFQELKYVAGPSRLSSVPTFFRMVSAESNH